MQLHLVDATYELFRAHYAPRPPVLGREGVVLSGVSGLCDQLLYLLREEGWRGLRRIATFLLTYAVAAVAGAAAVGAVVAKLLP